MPHLVKKCSCKGGDETRLGCVWYVQGNQPAGATCGHGLYVPKLWLWSGLWSEQTIGTCTYQTDHRDIYAIAIARPNVPLSSAHTWTLFHHPFLKSPLELVKKCSKLFNF